MAGVHLVLGHLRVARDLAEQAAAIQAETGHRLGEAYAHLVAERASDRLGRTVPARRHGRLARDLFTTIGVPAAGHVGAVLDTDPTGHRYPS